MYIFKLASHILVSHDKPKTQDMNPRLLISMAMLILLLSCEKWDLDRAERFIQLELEVLTDQDDLDKIGVAALSATIGGWQFEPMIDHGFLWTRGTATPTLLVHEGRTSPRARELSDGTVFTDTITGLAPNTAYRFVAFALVDGQEPFYSEMDSITTTTARVNTDSFRYIGGFELQAFGHLEGLKPGLSAVQHGFCWSYQNREPSLADIFLPLGPRRNNDPFTGTIGGLIDGDSLFIRAFAILSFELRQDTIYGESLSFGGNLNYWSETVGFGPDMPFRSWPPHFVIGDTLYLSNGVGPIREDENYVWSFSVNKENGLSSWKRKSRYPGLKNGEVGFMLEINGKELGYMGGGYDPQTGKVDFWEYDATTGKWCEMTAPPLPVEENGNKSWRRGTGIFFGIDGKGYVGSGLIEYGDGVDSIKLDRIPTYDMWMFDPLGETHLDSGSTLPGRWIRIGNYPKDKHHFAHPNIFVIDHKAYIAGGDNRSHDFLIEFDPNAGPALVDASGKAITDSQGAAVRAGRWTEKARYSGGKRYRTAGFALNGKAYLGLGTQGWFREDIWAYDPTDLSNGLDVNGNPMGKWSRVADFIGPFRIDAYGFSVGGKGYIGLGTNGNSPFKDFWEYID